MRGALIEVELTAHFVRPKAVLVSPGDVHRARWVPKALMRIEGEWKEGAIVMVTMPERVAVEKELVDE
jgi:hypothetical protein